ncbi:MAG: 3-mercaptopyruvate sulfurtransferase [Alphaproteobacteria bacterium]|nr:3-mercaptopyruvate sulfurtransferase [Alphaproteobacteria bacterium]MBU0797986.1 3-mercaptopyruvate sulfurtransferase [Alphaproteobacteria bacterium]MBU1814835.1 3-mercaptopyruvate sulfurtransferase [Alphaproteobacteria bacterium]
MPYAKPDALVSTAWLQDHLDAPDVRIVDATYFMPAMKKSGRTEYEARHIPGAVFFDIDEIAAEGRDLPHMLPTAEKFASRMRALGIGDGNHVIIYDQHGLMSAARAWWMLRVFGHKEVSVLDGGLPKWLAEDRPVDDRPPVPRQNNFTARFNNTLVRELDQVRGNLDSKAEQIVDARSAGRWRGVEPEVWPGRPGRIPGSLNVPFTDLLNPADKTVKPAEQLTARFAEGNVDLGRPITTSCGSGITACVLALGLYLVGRDDVAVYDGSWAEWGKRDDTPVDLG